jgi:hypothetical protein
MKFAPTLLLALAGLAGSGTALAGPFNDALSVCLVKSTSAQDRTVLARWVFAAMAQHPQVVDLAKVSKAEADQLNKDVADLFWALVSDRCGKETRDAVQYEGANTISSSFEVLGKVAMQGLMAEPAVNEYMARMGSHLDEGKLKELFSPTAPATAPPPVEPAAPVKPGKQ